jgi:very-short-patch-repair endonuclease
VWGIFKRWEMPFEVTVPSSRRRRGIRVHRAKLRREDISYQSGIRVTSAARTILDIAPRITGRALTRAVNDLRRPGYLHLHQLEDLVRRFPRNPGSRRLRPLLDPPDGNPTRSHLEDDFVAFARRYKLPRPQVNVQVVGRQVDAWYPEERVIVEIDSWEFHSDRDTFETDREKDAAALELGIATVRLTKRRMRESPEHEADRVRRILRARRAG